MKKILFFLLISTAALSQPYNGAGVVSVTGQGTQTASGNNIILATAGTSAYDALTYNEISIQIIVTGTVSSGVVTFEGSNDNTNFVAFPLFDELALSANPVTTISPLTGIKRYLNGPIHYRYIRARISTVIGGGGSLQAFTKFSSKTYQPDIVAITQDDFNVTGQATQTATVNNIITDPSSSAASDVSGFKSASVQVNSTGTAGTYIFEGSNDNLAFVTIPVWNQLILTGTPITAAVTASNTNIVYIFPVTTRYVRLRIASTITGGSIRAISKFSQSAYAPGIQQVAQATGTNLAVAVASGTVTTLSNGQTAHSSASTGSPLRAAGRVAPTTIATVDATLVAGDAADVPSTTGNQIITKAFSTAELDYTFNFSTVASTTTVQPFVPASGTANVRNYISQLAISTDALGTGGVAWILDGALTVSSIAITTGLCTTSTSHDLKIGDAVVFTALAAGTGVSTNTVYYVTSVGSVTTFNFALTIGGANVVPSVAYTGTTVYRILYQQHFRATGIPQSTIITFRNPLRGIANMITNFLIPTTMTSGTIYITSNGYRGF
jgi:hypothetical protein